jgi:hypothetical protein
MTESEKALTTSDLAAQPTDSADRPHARDEDRGGDNAARPDNEATLQAQSEPATTPLLSTDQSADLDGRWNEIQTAFVDEPRQSVERADQLVAELMQQLAKSFAETRNRLEQQWDSGDDVSTEDLRLALTRYRSFFHRLLAA